MDKLTATLMRADPPVADLAGPGLSLKVERDLGIAKLRVALNTGDAAFQRVTGFAPPPPRRQIERAALTFAWMAPDEWLVTGQEAEVAAWLVDVDAKGDEDALALDFTHARVSFELTGSNVRAALSAHCPLDLWPGAFPEGAAARSVLGETRMFIARLADADGHARFRIVVDQTMAPYARRLFARA